MCHSHDCRRVEGLVKMILISQSADFVLFCLVSQSTISRHILIKVLYDNLLHMAVDYKQVKWSVYLI